MFLSCPSLISSAHERHVASGSVLDSMDIEHVHRCRKFYCTALVSSILKQYVPVDYVILNCAVL